MMDAVLKNYNGAMTLFIQGQPYPFTTYKPTELNDDQLFETTVKRSVADMAARGVHVHFVPIFFKWTGPRQYDFSPMDWRINTVLQADPAAWIVIRVQAGSMAPAWWLDANPNGVLTFGLQPGVAVEPCPHRTHRSPSLGSNFWDEAGLPALQALAEHVRRQPYLDRIIGYLPTSYNSNEWFFRSYDELQVSDLCPAMCHRLQQWLKDEWSLAGDGPVPDRVARQYGDRGYFFHPDPRQSRAPVTAYYQLVNRLCAETIVKISQTLRVVHAPDRIIVGTFYGYAQGMANFYWLADSGHLALARLLEQDGPDFTCSPLEYFTRSSRERPGGGFCWSQGTAADSARLAGKAYFGEDDFCPCQTTGLIGWSGAGDKREDVEMLKRNFVFTLCKGQLQWWYDLHGHWFEGQARLKAVKQCVTIANAALARDRSPVATVAVVMDEQVSTFMTLDRQIQRALCWENFYYSFDRLGAPVDLLLLSDLAHTDMRRYQAVFFPTTFALTQADRERIEALKTHHRTLVFYQADGFIDRDRSDAFRDDGPSALAGIKIAVTKKLFQMRVTTRTGHPLLQGVEDTPFGVHTEKMLNFYVDDPTVEPLGHFNGRDAVGLARKVFPNWTSIYSGAPALPAQLVQNIIRAAGVHIYGANREDILYANVSYVGVFTIKKGKKTVQLPRPARVRECFSGRVLAAEPVSTFAWRAQAYQTYLFELS